MEDSEVFNIEPLFSNLEDEMIHDMHLSIIHLRYLLDCEKRINKELLVENLRLKNQIKISNHKLRKHKY